MSTTQTSKRFDQLSADKRALLQRRLAQRSAELRQARGIAALPRNRATRLPATALQAEFWFRWRLFPEEALDNIAGYVRLDGELTAQVIEAAFAHTVARHEVLRSRFVQDEQGLAVEIDEQAAAPLTLLDLRDAPEGALERELEAAVRQPFDLSAPPLIRLYAYRMAPTRWVLLMVMHHIVSDGSSSARLIREMVQAMRERMAGRADLRPELPIQFYDYAAWLEQRAQDGQLAREQDYWMDKLTDAHFELQLADRPVVRAAEGTPAGVPFAGDRVPVHISAARHRAVQAYCQRHLVTEFAFYLAALRVLIYRYCRQQDLVIVVPVEGRQHPAVADLIGCFLNMVGIRSPIDGQMDFSAIVQQEQQGILAALDHQGMPFGRVLQAHGVPHGQLESVYSLVFSYEANPLERLDAAPFSIAFEECFVGRAKADLVLELNQRDGGLEGWFEFREQRFSRQQIRWLAANYVTLVDSLLTRQRQAIAQLPVVSDEEQALVAQFGRGPRGDWPIETMTAMFARQAAARPDAVALRCDGEAMCYGELDRCSTQLAQLLRAEGLGATPDMVAAIMMRKSMAFVVSVLAVLKAGAAFVPLEPDDPEARAAFILRDSGASLLLSDGSRQLPLDCPPACRLLHYDERLLEQAPDGALPEQHDSARLAYIIYTSGTTGQPKGVMVEHHGVSNLAHVFASRYGIGPDDRILQFSHIAFDACVWELAISILLGGRLVIVERETLLDLPRLVQLVRDEGVTVTYFSPPFWKQIAHEQLSFRVLLTAGSSADTQLVRSAARSEVYVNGYGPTENTVAISLWDWRPGDALPERVPIGEPIANTEVLILADGQVCGVGMTGEICVAGEGLARAYLNQAELTARQFITHPNGRERLYRTGDYGRWREDGLLEFAGRIDTQVKIRGYRIEIGEIVAQLEQYPGIRQAYVLAETRAQGEPLLHAYLVREGALDIPELERWLEARVPDYMLPRHYHGVDRIPLTSNDKVDEAALRSSAEALHSGARYVAPETETERRLAAIYAEVLGCGRVGRHDAFFDLGGDSILLLQVIGRAAEQGIHTELASFYEARTLAAIAQRADQSRAAGMLPPGQAQADAAGDPERGGEAEAVAEDDLATILAMFG